MKKILKTLGIILLSLIISFIMMLLNIELNHSNKIVSSIIFIVEFLVLIFYPWYLIIRAISLKSPNQYSDAYIFRMLLPFIAGVAAMSGFLVFTADRLFNLGMISLLGGIFIMGILIVSASKKQRSETDKIKCKLASGELSEREYKDIETVKGKVGLGLAVLALILVIIKLIRLF